MLTKEASVVLVYAAGRFGSESILFTPTLTSVRRFWRLHAMNSNNALVIVDHPVCIFGFNLRIEHKLLVKDPDAFAVCQED